MAIVYCRFCAKEINETALICPHCGSQQGAVTNQSIKPNIKMYLDNIKVEK